MSALHELIKYGSFFGGKGSGGSGGGTQPDWNQNDPTKADYVKNRPFWTDDPKETVLFDGVVNTEDWFPLPLVDGNDYKVTLDGMEYTVKATFDGAVYIGSRSLWYGEEWDSSEVPFAMCDQAFFTVNEGEQHTLKVVGDVVEIHKIDPKYVPNEWASFLELSKYFSPVIDFQRVIPWEWDTRILANPGTDESMEPVSLEEWENFVSFVSEICMHSSSGGNLLAYEGRLIGCSTTGFNDDRYVDFRADNLMMHGNGVVYSDFYTRLSYDREKERVICTTTKTELKLEN